jgi:O-antigen ligase
MIDLKNYVANNNWQDIFFKMSTYFFVCTLPLFLNLNTIALWVFALGSILTFKKHNGYINLKRNIYIILPTFILFILYALGLWLSEDISRVLKDIGRVVPLIVIPLLVSMHKKQDFDLKNIYKFLGFGLFSGMLICWYFIVESILSKADPAKQASYFFQWIYTDFNLVKPLGGHPSYFAILIVLFISAVSFSKEFKSFRNNKMKLVLLLIPFFLFLIETSSRIGVLTVLAITLYHAIRQVNVKLLLSVVALIFIVGLSSIKFDYLGSKFKKMISQDGEVSIERVDRWKEIVDVFKDKEKLFIGAGSGDARLIYREAYSQGGFDLALKENYNAHNQYLEFFVSNGIIGVFLYLLVLCYIINQTHKEINAIHFFLIFVIFSLSESFLGRSQGVMIFSFFYSFLLLYKTTSKNIKFAA